jgi:16S rRNA (uracil1498-N3)-methyltransferase
VRTLLCGALAPGRLRLDPAESHHLLHVLRATRGTAVRLSDGAGRHAEAVLVAIVDGSAELEVAVVHTARRPAARMVILGAPRPALAEEAATLATEAGATAFWLTGCVRAHPGAPRPDRLERVVDAALKQCRRAERPDVRVFPDLGATLAALEVVSHDGPVARYVAQPGGAGPDPAVRFEGAALAVGPEGGWAASELDALAARAFTLLGLGPHVLRAPTAVVAGLAVLSAGRISGW